MFMSVMVFCRGWLLLSLPVVQSSAKGICFEFVGVTLFPFSRLPLIQRQVKTWEMPFFMKLC